MDPLSTALLVAGSLAGFAAFWSAVVWLIAQAGGWGSLGRRFATEASPSPQARRVPVSSGSVGTSRYNGVLRVHVQPGGLRLSVLAPFRPGHPPVLIPWAEIASVDRRTFLGLSRFEVAVGNPRIATLTLPEAVVTAMRDALPTAVVAE